MFAKQNGAPILWAFRPGVPKQQVAKLALRHSVLFGTKNPGLLPGLKMIAVASRPSSRVSYLELIRAPAGAIILKPHNLSHLVSTPLDKGCQEKKAQDTGELPPPPPYILWVCSEETVKRL